MIIKLAHFVQELSDNTSDKIENNKISKIYEEIKKELTNSCKQSLKKYFTNNNLSVLKLYTNFIDNIEKYYINEHNALNIKKYTSDMIKNKKIDIEDLPALMYIKFKICGSMHYSDIKQIIVDEAQDYGDFNFYILKEIFNNSYFSIFGDLAQSIYSYKSIKNWDSVLTKVFNNNACILNLQKSYRTTIEIMEAANCITKKLGLNTAIPVIRHGEKVKYFEYCEDYSTLLNQINILQQKNYKSIAIISKTIEESEKIYNILMNNKINVTDVNNSNTQYLGGICTIPSHLSKGLEFDAVIISDASEEKFHSDNTTDMKLLYVSMTRPLHELIIIHKGILNSVLKNSEN